MDSFVIDGPVRLAGSVDVSGAKNAVLPAMTAALLTEGTSVLEGVPQLRDTETMAHLLRVSAPVSSTQARPCASTRAATTTARRPTSL